MTHSSSWSQSFSDKTWHTAAADHSLFLMKHDTQQQLIYFSENDTHQQLITVFFWQKWCTSAAYQSSSNKTWHTPATGHGLFWQNMTHTSNWSHPSSDSLYLTKHDTLATDQSFFWQNMPHISKWSQLNLCSMLQVKEELMAVSVGATNQTECQSHV